MGVDAFAHSWQAENLWLCPPVSKIIPTIRKLKSTSPVSGVLIVPAWTAAPFWPLLFPSSNERPKFIQKISEFRPTIVQNQRALSPLSGLPPFAFLMIHISSC